MQTKICSVCGKEKSVEDFYLVSKKKPRPRSECKACHKAYRDKHAVRRYAQVKDLSLKRNYGISLADYCNMFLEQDGRCAICGTKNQENTKCPLMVDHDHKTQQVRKLLCTKCNIGLGHFQDDPRLLQKAAEYLQQFKQKDT
ncbi:MAG: hypothetical protein DRP65_07190 [Planctomycetota bacterium]|nr:MAG: hypothetical protein DRP65_07190 [Planctomycetota bacterium]